jgi:hypothetical protein
MGIQPDQKDIYSEEQSCPPRDQEAKYDADEIEKKINFQLDFLAYDTVNFRFDRLVDQVLFTVIKVIDDVSGGNDTNGGKDDEIKVQVKNDLFQREIGRKNKDGRKVLCQYNDRNIVAPYNRK